MSIKYYIIGFSIIIASCTNDVPEEHEAENNSGMDEISISDSVHISDLVNWYQNDSEEIFKKSIESKGFTFKLTYRPGTYYAALDLNGEIPNQEKWDSLVEQYSSLMYFELEINSSKRDNDIIAQVSPNNDDYDKNIRYLNFSFGEGIQLNYEGKSHSIAVCQMEQTIGIRPGIKFLFSFEKFEMSNDFSISIFDPVFSGEQLEFQIIKNTVINEPTIFI